MKRKTVSPGSGKPNASTNSAGEPASIMVSISSLLRRRMYGSRVWILRLLNPWRVKWRMRPWSGSGRFDITAIGL